jgi:hypothetical protein
MLELMLFTSLGKLERFKARATTIALRLLASINIMEVCSKKTALVLAQFQVLHFCFVS